ncbi:MAG: adenosylcobinamide amidohydrolase [Methanobacterium sp. ERen5]|nr:MAG: adenosylcobinamide amidohydrolase [Methanobacterium sp. ERen5]
MACKKEFINNNDTSFILKTGSGIIFSVFDKCLVGELPINCNTLSTSVLNGGYKENLEAIFNHQLDQKLLDELEDQSIPDYMYKKAKKLGFNPEKVSGLLTAANIENYAVSKKSFKDIDVTAIVTGGVTCNAGTAGDEASFYEEDGRFITKIGTINTILIIEAHLDECTLTKAMMTAVEAKAAALQRLMVPSKYSMEIATGTGTDGIILISNMNSKNKLTNASKHSKLGELIGTSIIEATQKALSNESNITPESQLDMIVRMERFGITETSYLNYVNKPEKLQNISVDNLKQLSKDPVVVAAIVAMLHIEDEVRWKMIPEEAGKKAAYNLMKSFFNNYKLNSSEMDIENSIINYWTENIKDYLKHSS